MIKQCTKCLKSKELIHFYKNKNHKDGLAYYCKECQNSASRSWSRTEKGKQSKSISDKNFKIKHADALKVRNEILYATEEFKIKNRTKSANFRKKNPKANGEYHKQRKRRDINFKLATNARTRLNQALKTNQKIGSAVTGLGCSVEELRQYLELKFQPGMTWENWGRTGWHIDHIQPLNSFDLTKPEQFKQAVHYTNLQPLWAKDNWKKYTKLSPIQEI